MRRPTTLILKLSLLTSLFLCQSWSAENRRPEGDTGNAGWGLSLPSLWPLKSQPAPTLSSNNKPMPSISSASVRPTAKPTANRIVKNSILVTEPEAPIKFLQDKINALGVPTPPRFIPLTTSQNQTLIDKAKSGDDAALQTLLKRVQWRAMKNPLTIEDVLKIPNIEEKALSPEGYLYWSILRTCNGIHKIAGLTDKIKSYAVTYHFAPAQYAYGLMCADNFSNEQIKFYELSAEQDYAPAQFRLGEIYEKGLDGDFIDEEKAKEFYKKSAEQNYLPGMNSYVTFLMRKDNTLDARYFFHSCWACMDDPYYTSMLISALATNILIYKTTKYGSEFLKIDQETYFQEMTIGSSKLSSKHVDWNFQEPPRLQKEILTIASIIEETVCRIPEVISLMRSIEPGFLVDCIEFGRFGEKEGFMKRRSLFHKPKKEYIIIGVQNNLILDKVWKWYESYNAAQCELTPIYRKHEKKARKLQDKLAHYTAKKEALEQLRAPEPGLSSAEGDIIPQRLVDVNLDIHLYEKMIQNLTPDFKAVIGLKEGMDQIARAFQKYVEDGVHQRNKDFMKIYSIYR